MARETIEGIIANASAAFDCSAAGSTRPIRLRIAAQFSPPRLARLATIPLAAASLPPRVTLDPLLMPL